MKNENGFSLIEIILALAILATIGLITINILAGQIATRQKISEINIDEHSIDAALNRITRDLQGAYISNQNYSSALNLSNRQITPQFYYKENQLIFFTMSFQSYLNGSNQSNQAMIRYNLQTNNSDSTKKQLVRVVDTNFTESIEKPDVGLTEILLDDVESLSFEFWNGNNYQKEWTTQSNDTLNKLPKMVKVHLSTYSVEKQPQLGNKISNENRKNYTLDTIVYLYNTQGQSEVSTPSWEEFKWQ